MEEVYPQKNKKVTTSEKKVVTWEKNRFLIEVECNLVILLDKVIFISYYSYISNYTNKEIVGFP